MTLTVFSQSANDFYQLALEYESKGMINEAIDSYTQAIRLAPSEPGLYNSRGIAYKKNKNYKAAIDDYNAAIRLDPKFVYAYNNRGIARYFNRDYKASRDDFYYTLQLNPYEPYYYFLYMIASYKVSRSAYKEALQYLMTHKDYITAEWPYAIANFLLGRITSRQFLDEAHDAPDKMAEAFCYMGFQKVFNRRRFWARFYFKRCVQYNQTQLIEHELAKDALVRRRHWIWLP